MARGVNDRAQQQQLTRCSLNTLHLTPCTTPYDATAASAAVAATPASPPAPPRLNTCISARNYAHFYFLSVCGSLLYLYMSAVGVLTLIWSDKDDQRDAFGSLTASRIAWGVFIAGAGWIAVSFVALAGFHTYLLVVGLGTYDWVVLQVCAPALLP